MDENQFMVVGIDGSPESVSALEWASGEVDRFGLIQPVIAWSYPWWSMSPTPSTPRTTPVTSTDFEWKAEAQRVAEQTLGEIQPRHRRGTLVLHGSAGPALVNAAAEASLIVVGTRRRSRVATTVLGSVSLHCVNHATVPVVVVPPDSQRRRQQNRVVVGIDGSENSQKALEWALANTRPESTIEAVYVWDAENVVTAEVAALARDRLNTDACRRAEAVVARALSNTTNENPNVEIRTPCGDPRIELQEAATKADLLIMGPRGLESVAYLLLGSVATALVNHPEVPTVIVR